MRKNLAAESKQAWDWLRWYAKKYAVPWEEIVAGVNRFAPHSNVSASAAYVSFLKKKLELQELENNRRREDAIRAAGRLANDVFDGVHTKEQLKDFLLVLLFEGIEEIARLSTSGRKTNAKPVRTKKG